MQSRRDFFRGLTGRKAPGHLNWASAVQAYVQTNLLPYDFCLTDDQVDHLLHAVSSEITERDAGEFSGEERRRMAMIAEETIRPWRDEYWKAEEKRRDAAAFVREFLGDRDPDAAETERRALSWLYELPNTRLAPLSEADLRSLVFSQLSAWRDGRSE